MLKGIPKILSPELLKVLAEMGHSDRLVISDGNFPAESMGKDAIVIRCDGHGVPEILDAILQVFPLDSYVEHPVNLMEVMPGDTVETPIWDTYKEIIRKYDDRGDAVVGNIERFAFYDEAKTAYAIIATGESALYANVMLQKSDGCLYRQVHRRGQERRRQHRRHSLHCRPGDRQRQPRRWPQG